MEQRRQHELKKMAEHMAAGDQANDQSVIAPWHGIGGQALDLRTHDPTLMSACANFQLSDIMRGGVAAA